MYWLLPKPLYSSLRKTLHFYLPTTLEHRSLNDVSRLYDLKYPGTSLVKAKESIRYFHDIMDDEPNMLLRPFNKKDIENRMLMATLEPNKVFMKTIKAEKKIDINEDISKNKNQSRGRSL
jgi:hypothetical protein